MLANLAWGHGSLDANLYTVDAEILAQPQDPALYVRRAQLHLAEGDVEQAILDLRSAQARGGDVALDLATLSADEATLDALLPAPHAKAHAARGALRAERGDLVGAVEDLDAAVALDPTPERFLARMRVAERVDPQLAIDGLTQAPGAVCALERVRLLRETGQTRLAREGVDALLEQNPEHPEWLLLRAELSIFGRPYRRRAAAILEQRLQSRPSAQNQALYARSQGGCGHAAPCAWALWPAMLLILRRRRG